MYLPGDCKEGVRAGCVGEQLTCWLVAIVNVVMGMAMGTACTGCCCCCWPAACSPWSAAFHWIVPGEIIVAKVGLVATNGRPPYSGFS